MNHKGGYSYKFFNRNEWMKTKSSFFYEFYFNLNGRTYKEFGITINWKSRSALYRSDGVSPFDISLTKMPLYEAFICEQEMKHRSSLQHLRLKNNPGFAGWTECFDVTGVNLFHPVHSV